MDSFSVGNFGFSGGLFGFLVFLVKNWIGKVQDQINDNAEEIEAVTARATAAEVKLASLESRLVEHQREVLRRLDRIETKLDNLFRSDA